MGLLDLSQVSELQPYLTLPQADARMFVYAPGTETLSQLFKDEDLTEMQANPLKGDSNGNFSSAFLLNGQYRVVIVSNQGKLLGEAASLTVRNPLKEIATVKDLVADRSMTYSGQNGTSQVIAGDLLRVSRGGFTYRVGAETAQNPDLQTANGVRLYTEGRGQFTPEAFGAEGDGTTNDTDAWNAMFRAALFASAIGPVRVRADGDYLLDELEPLSQYSSVGQHPIQNDSMVIDLMGCRLIHSGVGEGLLSLEGIANQRYRYDLQGGIWQAHTNSKWMIRCRDVRGSTFAPEAFVGPSPTVGILTQNWRAWSENNQYGGSRTLEGREIGSILTFQGREEAWAHELTEQGLTTVASSYRGYGGSDPVDGTVGDFYYNAVDEIVRRYTGTLWQPVIDIESVQTGTLGKSFARTKINNVLIASAHDVTKDGLAIYVDGASLYDSHINGLRGNVANDGGSLIYWNDNFAVNTVIENVGCEKAIEPGQAVSYAFRTGPNFATSTETPDLININWSGGFAEPVDPDAGVLMNGQYLDKFIDTTAGTPVTLFKAGQIHANTTAEIVLKSNSNEAIGKALVARKSTGTTIRIEDQMARSVTAGPWSQDAITASNPITEMVGPRWIAPANGWITAITLISDTAITAGTCTAAVRHNSGLAGDGGASVGMSAVLRTSAPTRVTKRQYAGIDGFLAGDEIYAIVTSNSSLAPSGANVRAIIEVQIDGDISWQDDNGDLTVRTDADETLRIMTKTWKT